MHLLFLIVPFVGIIENTLIYLNAFKTSISKPSSEKISKGRRYFHATRSLKIYVTLDVYILSHLCVNVF